MLLSRLIKAIAFFNNEMIIKIDFCHKEYEIGAKPHKEKIPKLSGGFFFTG
jgi:hypothetical protein